jgi:hypothetical protein
MAIVQLLSPADFNNAVAKHWDEVDPITRGFVAPDTIVSRRTWNYRLDSNVQIFVNETGPVVRRRDCSNTDFDCNFWLGDSMLAAADPSPSSDVLEAPIRLRFSPAVRAVGAWIGVSPKNPFDAPFFAQPLFATLWVMLQADPTQWHLVTANGWTGHASPVGTPLTAPFVGARASGGGLVSKLRFNASLLGNRRFDKIALSELSVEV